MKTISDRRDELLSTAQGELITMDTLGQALARVIGSPALDATELRNELMLRLCAASPRDHQLPEIAQDVATWMVRQHEDAMKRAGVDLLKWLVDRGGAWAMYNLAIEKILGVSCPHDIEGANALLVKACEAAGAETVLLGLVFGALGDSYLQGRGFEQDALKAQQLYEHAAEYGNPEAAFNAGLYYDPITATAALRNSLKAAYFYELAVDGGLRQAMVRLGVLHATLAFPGADPRVGACLLAQAAGSGDSVARAALAAVTAHFPHEELAMVSPATG